MLKLAALLVITSLAAAQGRRPHEIVPIQPQTGERVAWFGTLEAGLAEAKRTQRPILLVAAAPHCQNVPGIW